MKPLSELTRKDVDQIDNPFTLFDDASVDRDAVWARLDELYPEVTDIVAEMRREFDAGVKELRADERLDSLSNVAFLLAWRHSTCGGALDIKFICYVHALMRQRVLALCTISQNYYENRK